MFYYDFFFGQGSKYQNACLYVNFVLKFWNIKKWSLNTVLRNELEWTLTSGPDPQTLNCCLILFINRNIIYMYIFKYLLWNKTMTECTLKVRKLCRPILLFKKKYVLSFLNTSRRTTQIFLPSWSQQDSSFVQSLSLLQVGVQVVS